MDTKRDPHTPTQGFLFGHIAWIFDSYGLTKKVSPKHVEDFEAKDEKRKISRNMFVGYLKYGRPNNAEDLQNQGFYRFLRRTYILHHFGLAIILYALGGLPFLTWGMVNPVILALILLFFILSRVDPKKHHFQMLIFNIYF